VNGGLERDKLEELYLFLKENVSQLMKRLFIPPPLLLIERDVCM
jgi:hypothetical protein